MFRKILTILRRIVLGLLLLGMYVPSVHSGAFALVAKAEAENQNNSGSLVPLLGPDGIDWNTFRAIEAAVAEGTRRGLRLEQCYITAEKWDHRLIVSFGNPNPSHKWKGCPPGPCTCLDVVLAEDGTRVLEADRPK